jgi:CheY-like chemotaxis protein
MRVERVPFDLHESVHKVLELFRRSLERKKLRATIEIEPEVPVLVEGDPGRLRQVLLNLVGNAVKFTEHGGITLRCRCRNRRAERAEVELEVADTGPGIPPARLEALFQPFTQADDSITRRHGGTGLGLSIGKQLVTLMGGRIEVESTLGSGSTFRFTVVLDVPSSFSSTSPVVPMASVPAATIRQARVLLAEDSPVNQRVASSQLARLGYMVELVSNGAEAVKAARRGDFDVILMDCHMPELSGFEAARQICAELGSSKPPIIALTASALEEDRDRCLAAGMDAFISKPVKLDALAKVLAEWVPESS